MEQTIVLFKRYFKQWLESLELNVICAPQWKRIFVQKYQAAEQRIMQGSCRRNTQSTEAGLKPIALSHEQKEPIGKTRLGNKQGDKYYEFKKSDDEMSVYREVRYLGT